MHKTKSTDFGVPLWNKISSFTAHFSFGIEPMTARTWASALTTAPHLRLTFITFPLDVVAANARVVVVAVVVVVKVKSACTSETRRKLSRQPENRQTHLTSTCSSMMKSCLRGDLTLTTNRRSLVRSRPGPWASLACPNRNQKKLEKDALCQNRSSEADLWLNKFPRWWGHPRQWMTATRQSGSSRGSCRSLETRRTFFEPLQAWPRDLFVPGNFSGGGVVHLSSVPSVGVASAAESSRPCWYPALTGESLWMSGG